MRTAQLLLSAWEQLAWSLHETRWVLELVGLASALRFLGRFRVRNEFEKVIIMRCAVCRHPGGAPSTAQGLAHHLTAHVTHI